MARKRAVSTARCRFTSRRFSRGVTRSRMATPLKRLLPYHDRYKVPFWGGMSGLMFARVFEATIPLFLRDGIDRIVSGNAGIVAGSIDYSAARAALAWP